MSTIEAGKLRFGADATAVVTAVQSIEKSVANLSKETQPKLARIATSLNAITTAAGKVLSAVGAAGKKAFAPLIEFEKESTRLSGSFGGMENAKDVVRELREQAANGVASLSDLTSTAQKLSGVFRDTDDVVRYTTAFHNLAAGTGEDVERLVRSFVQMQASGKVSASTINSFAGRGVNLWGAMAKATGKTVDELQQMATAGKLTGDEVGAALLSMTEGTGQFAGAAEKMSGTLSGAIETAKAKFDIFLSDAVEPLADDITGIIKSLTDFFEHNMGPFTTLLKNFVGNMERGLNAVQAVIDFFGGNNGNMSAAESDAFDRNLSRYKKKAREAAEAVAGAKTQEDYDAAVAAAEKKMDDAEQDMRMMKKSSQQEKEQKMAIATARENLETAKSIANFTKPAEKLAAPAAVEAAAAGVPAAVSAAPAVEAVTAGMPAAVSAAGAVEAAAGGATARSGFAQLTQVAADSRDILRSILNVLNTGAGAALA